MERDVFYELYKRPEWKAKRKIILERDNYQCQLCGDNEGLQVHHIHYREEAAPWDVENIALITYCSMCHSIVHHCKDEFGNGFASFHPINCSVQDKWLYYTLMNLNAKKYKYLLIDIPVFLSTEGQTYKSINEAPVFAYYTDQINIPGNDLSKSSWDLYWLVRNNLNKFSQTSLANAIMKAGNHYKNNPNIYINEIFKHLNFN